jgi:serine O-acetyltransferase
VVGAGAKILGPITVGDDAKVGSNAVVVRDVPPGATAVGIPARIHTAEEAERREQQASRIGFSAYAIGKELDDPLVQAIHKLLEHAAATDARLDRLVEHLKEGGVELGDDRAVADGFDPKQIDRTLG